MGSTLTSADERKLVGVNARLVALVREVAREYPSRILVVEGVRTLQRQRQLVKDGKSKTLNSKHLVGRAVDICPIIDGRASWDWHHYTPLIACAKRIARRLNLPMTFGYDWGWDAPHWEMKEP